MWKRWGADAWLRAAVLIGFTLRVLPLVIWIWKPCVRDECTYVELAEHIMAGDGMRGTHGWLWAPAYPWLLAIHGWITGYPGTVEGTQLVLATLSIALVYELTHGEFGEGAARVAAWIYALNPTLVFYTSSVWSETIYSTLLLGALLSLRHAREGGPARALVPGVLVGLCVLFRGVATYSLPIFVLALLWRRWRQRAAWIGAVLCVAGAVATVAPYSAWATQRFGGFVISDRTLGQMMWLGNNDFPPMTFDYGNGVLTDRDYDRAKAMGRPHCPYTKDPVRQDDCEIENGKAWIAAHPREFLARVPVRVAQLLNPHSFLTRHLRWGKWVGTPPWLDEILIALVVVFSMVTMIGGTIGWVARGKGWYGLAAGLILLYHVGAIAVLAGLTRYRVPLEPIWLVFAAGFLVDARATLRTLFDGRPRTVAGLVLIVLVVAHVLRYLPVGWPSWRSW
ncbi:MAG: glycosyltransferase family 39 protein [Myxococcota bacterium]